MPKWEGKAIHESLLEENQNEWHLIGSYRVELCMRKSLVWLCERKTKASSALEVVFW